jgi:hypothetical protein
MRVDVDKKLSKEKTLADLWIRERLWRRYVVSLE